ncbi:type I methionyl aminopeptidase [Spiroplasma turonicum]|uniref:Methionine aminopeptidase n=1 Tax=Spiroplasma turonicum TaxID=216946 RepID=A0A0K1P7I0_9MOLU|nr:type I methionyl aminopeptidase [Spiroplasma turonicum]AKU80248.1 methionine aminopeptidase [Spiroplasma turonicum]ALX71249.1 methionine aminopeptidase [Spiroplasma turonicum]
MAITIKNKEQIEKMRYAGKVLSEALHNLKKMIKPGINCLELDKSFIDFITSKGCTSNFKGYYDYPAHICVSINEQLIHGIPKDRILKNGDIVSIDAGCIYEGYHSDSAFTVICGDSSNEKISKLVDLTERSLYLAIEHVRAGVRIGTISATVQNFIEDNGFHLPTSYSGHGIGLEMHEDPFIPNVGIKNTGMRLVPGMTICIEPMVQVGTNKTIVDDDKWTVLSKDGSMTAHFEHTVLVTEDDPEVLTLFK